MPRILIASGPFPANVWLNAQVMKYSEINLNLLKIEHENFYPIVHYLYTGQLLSLDANRLIVMLKYSQQL